MDCTINVLYGAAEQLCREMLRTDTEYSSVFAKNEKALETFCERHSEETVGTVLGMINECQHLDYLREQYFLLIGLHMGLELGSSNTLFLD